MYTRAYPPRQMPVPDNYSGVALTTEEVPPAEEPLQETTVSPPDRKSVV